MITHPGEYHDASSDTPIPQCPQTLQLIARGRLMPPLPIQVALRERRTAEVVRLQVPQQILDTEAA